MRRKFLVLFATAIAALALTAGPAEARPLYPGAGFVVPDVNSMVARFHVPVAHCAAGQNTAVIIGVISPAIGLLEGWNATAVVGCAEGTPWYRIQTWVNAVGGGHTVYPANPGDLIVARLLNANSSSPELRVGDFTTSHRVSNHLNPRLSPPRISAAGMYGGADILNFSMVTMDAWANGSALGDLGSRVRHNLARGSTLLIKSGYISSDATTYNLYFMHR